MKQRPVALIFGISMAALLLGAGCGSAVSFGSDIAADPTTGLTAASEVTEETASSAEETEAEESETAEEPADPLKQFDSLTACGDYEFSVVADSEDAFFWQAAAAAVDRACMEQNVSCRIFSACGNAEKKEPGKSDKPDPGDEQDPESSEGETSDSEEESTVPADENGQDTDAEVPDPPEGDSLSDSEDTEIVSEESKGTSENSEDTGETAADADSEEEEQKEPDGKPDPDPVYADIEMAENTDIADVFKAQAGSDIAAICAASQDGTPLGAWMKDCPEPEMPVVLAGPGSDSGEAAACALVFDQEGLGARAAEKLFGQLSGIIESADSQVRIGMLNSDSESPEILERAEAFSTCLIRLIHESGRTVSVEGSSVFVNMAEEADTGECDVVIEAEVPQNPGLAECSVLAEHMLQKENVIGVIGTDITATEAILDADYDLCVLGLDCRAGDVAGTGIGLSDKIFGAIEDGQLYGTVCPSPSMTGYYSVLAMTAAANGEETIDIPIGCFWYEASIGYEGLISAEEWE